MIYTLYLATQGGTQTPNTSNITWRVNWDNMFSGLPEEYKTCRVRFNLSSTTLEDTSTGIQYADRAGYIVANLVGTKQKTSVSYTQFGGVVLGQLIPEPIVQYNTTGTTKQSWIRYNSGTMLQKGVEVLRPVGTSELNIQIYAYPNSGTNPPALSAYDGDYTLIMEFDFDEE
jgi:hypothetical protein